jgi:hypothetical protein
MLMAFGLEGAAMTLCLLTRTNPRPELETASLLGHWPPRRVRAGDFKIQLDVTPKAPFPARVWP